MIDWVTATLPFSSEQKFAGGFVRSIYADGVVPWQTEKRLPVVGSYGAHFHIVSKGEGFINISGNPSKFLQGHNLFGSDNLCDLVVEVMKRICKALNVSICMNDYVAWREGNYTLQRADIAYIYSLDTRPNVRAWLRAAEYQSKSRHGRPMTKGGTVYWGKHSRRWAMKAYGKADELTSTKDHRLPQTIPKLLEHGIDIAVIQPKAAENVVQLIRALRPQAVACVPDWAKGTDLYFDVSCKKAA